MSEDFIKKARSAKSAEELQAVAESAGLKVTEEDAKAYYAKMHGSGELADEELDNVAGGGCGKQEQQHSGGLQCPHCQSRSLTFLGGQPLAGDRTKFGLRCNQCGQSFSQIGSTDDIWQLYNQSV